MRPSQHIFTIIGVGALLIASELLAFGSLSNCLNGFLARRSSVVLGVVSDAPKRLTAVNPGRFHWDWRASHELKADQSLRNARLPEQSLNAIAGAIADQIRPVMAELEIKSETELKKKALDTRIAVIDLNGDGTPEIVAQGMVNCGATGNCPFWVLQKSKQSGYEIILEGEAQTFTIQGSSTNGFRDIVLSTHGSYSSGGLTIYQYQEGVYRDVGCYNYEWAVLEGEKVQELKEPRITPCR